MAARNINLKVDAQGEGSGDVWDDGFHLAIQHIYIWYCDNCVNSIQFSYQGAVGPITLSDKHGGGRGTMFEMIKIDGAITELSGHYKNINGINRISSLKFVATNSGWHGPYGYPSGVSFCYKAENGIRGFHGHADSGYLNAIGVYVESNAVRCLSTARNPTAYPTIAI